MIGCQVNSMFLQPSIHGFLFHTMLKVQFLSKNCCKIVTWAFFGITVVGSNPNVSIFWQKKLWVQILIHILTHIWTKKDLCNLMNFLDKILSFGIVCVLVLWYIHKWQKAFWSWVDQRSSCLGNPKLLWTHQINDISSVLHCYFPTLEKDVTEEVFSCSD